MIAQWLECAAGAALGWATLRDVFSTAVIPRGNTQRLEGPRRLARAALAAWKRLCRRRVGVSFAPLMRVGAFVIWMALLVLAFGLLAYGVRDAFTPPLQGCGDALYRVGGAMTTSEHAPLLPRDRPDTAGAEDRAAHHR